MSTKQCSGESAFHNNVVPGAVDIHEKCLATLLAGLKSETSIGHEKIPGVSGAMPKTMVLSSHQETIEASTLMGIEAIQGRGHSKR